MTLEEKLININKIKLDELKSGDAHSLDDFWNQVIEKNLADDQVIINWHNLLVDYATKDSHPMFVIRGYGSASKDKYDMLRRGSLTETDDYDFFYTDNFYAAYICKMVLDGFVPTLDEFSDMMKTRKFPSRFGAITKNERELMGVPQGKNVAINAKGYKIAHIIPVGKDYMVGNSIYNNSKLLENYFPRGERADWKKHNDNSGDYLARTLSVDKISKDIAVAIFLRFNDPLNYILTPKQTCEINDMNKGMGIGEYEDLLNKAHNYFLGKYPKEYNKFLDLAMYPNKEFRANLNYNNNLNIDFGIGVNAKNKKIDNSIDDVTIENSASQVQKVKSKNSASKTSSKEQWAIYRSSITGGKKIGEYAVENILRIIKEGKLPLVEFNELLTIEGSFTKLGLSFAVFKEYDPAEGKVDRYYAPFSGKKIRVEYNGKTYLLCSEWYDKQIDKLKDWICNHK